MKYTFTIDTEYLNDPDETEDVVEDIKVLIRFLQRANPNYYLIGNMLDAQLNQQLEQDKQEDPKQQMIAKWNELWDEYVGVKLSDISDEGLKDNIQNFYSQIGEAMGPVCYAAFIVRKYAASSDIHKWLDKCIKYYEEHWEM
jgi:hypothetical protein